MEIWNTIPNPKYFWDSSQSTIKIISKFYFESENYEESEKWARELLNCKLLPNDANPYIYIGKSCFEANKIECAKENLAKAFKLGGRRGFYGKDNKYLKFAQESLKND